MFSRHISQPQAKDIYSRNWAVGDEAIQVYPSHFLNRVFAQPPSIPQIPEQVFVIIRVIIVILRAEPDGIELCHRASFAESFCKWPAFVLSRQLSAVSFQQGSYIPISIVKGSILTIDTSFV